MSIHSAAENLGYVTFRLAIGVFLWFFWSSYCTYSALAQELPPGRDESRRYETKELLSGLNVPSGLLYADASVGYEEPTVFFTESGNGWVCRLPLQEPSSLEVLVRGFQIENSRTIPALRAGPWSLGLLTPRKLVVCGGANSLASVYVLQHDELPLQAEQVDSTLHAEDSMERGSRLPRIVVGETTAYFLTGEAHRASLYKARLSANRLENAQALIASDVISDELRALCLSPGVHAQYLVAGSPGEVTDDYDSHVRFLIPETGQLAMKLKVGLLDLIGLEYSPSGQLYAIDYAGSARLEGGVFRIDDARWQGRPSCKVVRIARIQHPTSLAFVDEKTLLVTSAGEDPSQSEGKILSVQGSF